MPERLLTLVVGTQAQAAQNVEVKDQIFTSVDSKIIPCEVLFFLYPCEVHNSTSTLPGHRGQSHQQTVTKI